MGHWCLIQKASVLELHEFCVCSVVEERMNW